eukprot:TRINITY_DN1672_c0_g1_i1.p1 TRINITY_DN1672_c0_g1~~TRINITY_DN1672_c0_g1_i1.p1  ORF type:complete len:251 (-),score=20.26 TRINITY_DN1672_c0_g1_i1:129-881(-)
MMTKDTKRLRETEGTQKGDYAAMTHHWKLHRPNPRKKKIDLSVSEGPQESPGRTIQPNEIQTPFMDNIRLSAQWQAKTLINEEISRRIPLPLIRTDLYNPNYQCEGYPMEHVKRVRRPAVVEAMLSPDSFPKFELNAHVEQEPPFEASPPECSSPTDDSSAPTSPEESSIESPDTRPTFELKDASIQEHQFEMPTGHPHRSSLELFVAHADPIVSLELPSFRRESVDYAFWDHMIDLRRGSFEKSRDVLL